MQFARADQPTERWEQTGAETLDPGDGGDPVDVAVFTVRYTGRTPRPVDPDNDPPAGQPVVRTYTKRVRLSAFRRMAANRARANWTTTEGDV